MLSVVQRNRTLTLRFDRVKQRGFVPTLLGNLKRNICLPTLTSKCCDRACTFSIACYENTAVDAPHLWRQICNEAL